MSPQYQISPRALQRLIRKVTKNPDKHMTFTNDVYEARLVALVKITPDTAVLLGTPLLIA